MRYRLGDSAFKMTAHRTKIRVRVLRGSESREVSKNKHPGSQHHGQHWG